MDFSGNEEGRNRAIVAPTGIQDTGLEFDQGNNQLILPGKSVQVPYFKTNVFFLGMYKIRFDLYENGSKEDSGKGSVDKDSFVGGCTTNYVWATNSNGDEFGEDTEDYMVLKNAKASYENVMFKPGKTWNLT